MTSGIRTVIYPVKDLAQAKTLFRTLLGVAPARMKRTTSGSAAGARTSV